MTAPGYSHWTLFSVCMDCCCSLSAPNWASYKLHHSSLDWSAQQVVGSLHSYPDQDEERLASPEVPGTGGLKIHLTLLTAIWRQMWQVLRRVLMHSTRGQQDKGDSHTKGAAVTPKQDTPVQETLLEVMSKEAPWLTVLCCLLWKETWPMESSVFVISRVVVQWYKCYLSEVPYLCNPLPVFVLYTDRLPTTMYCFAVVSVYPLWVSADDESWILNLCMQCMWQIIKGILDNSCIFV